MRRGTDLTAPSPPSSSLILRANRLRCTKRERERINVFSSSSSSFLSFLVGFRALSVPPRVFQSHENDSIGTHPSSLLSSSFYRRSSSIPIYLSFFVVVVVVVVVVLLFLALTLPPPPLSSPSHSRRAPSSSFFRSIKNESSTTTTSSSSR